MYSTSAVLSSPAVRSASLPIVSTSRSPATLTPIAANRLYPVTIVQTRYGGIYEGGAWAALLSHPEEIPPDAFGGDSVCVPGGPTSSTRSALVRRLTRHLPTSRPSTQRATGYRRTPPIDHFRFRL